MQSGILKPAALVFLAALALYAAAYSCTSHYQQRRGPWQVTFAAEANGSPAITIRQPKLGVEEFKIIFAGEQPPAGFRPATLLFDAPAMQPPFGEWVFDDLMIQPGTVVLNLFDHGIQLLPRALTVNAKEHPWQARATLTVTPEQKQPPKPPRSDTKKKQ